jgi:uncharacterized protein (TIGR02246 family)
VSRVTPPTTIIANTSAQHAKSHAAIARREVASRLIAPRGADGCVDSVSATRHFTRDDDLPRRRAADGAVRLTAAIAACSVATPRARIDRSEAAIPPARTASHPATETTMRAHTPEDLHAQFQRHFTSGDLDALVALYEPKAALVPQPGQVVHGHAAIRSSLAAFLAMKGAFRMAPPKVIRADDTALLFASWTLDAKAPDGSPIHLEGQTSDVVRRQADGHWLMAIDSPFGAAGAT